MNRFLVAGGYEIDHPLYIGRLSIQGKPFVGKIVVQPDGTGHMYYNINGSEEMATEYEVLEFA